MPLVSVVTATRDRTDLLARALRSVERQTLTDIEAIVVDDGSSPEVLAHTHALLRELGPRFKLIQATPSGGKGRGPASSRNCGLFAATGEFVAFLDDDDQWPAAWYLEEAARALSQHGADYFFGHLEGVRDGSYLNPGWVPPREILVANRQVNRSPAIHELSSATALLIAQRFMIHPTNSVVRRTVATAVGGFFTGLWSHAEDVNFMLRLLDACGKILYTPELVALYRLPTGNSISLTETLGTHLLQSVLATQHARQHCRRAEFRRVARARESWVYREMALAAMAQQDTSEARRLGRQAFAVFPSMGSARFLTTLFLRSFA